VIELRVRRHTVDVGISLDLDRPTVTALFGPSGSGKTTVLRALAGLDDSGGGVLCGDDVWDDGRVIVPARRRGLGYVFQDPALFPHLDVRRNVEHGLHALSRGERRSRAMEALALVGAGGLADRRVTTLSGGEAQRVALARALAPRPRAVLLDEPLSALDTPTRTALRAELREVLTAAAVPAVLVTHDRAEVLALADEVVLLDGGRVLQRGTPVDVFSRPGTPEAAAVVGVETVVPGIVVGRTVDGLVEVRVGDRRLLGTTTDDPPGSGEALVCIRAEDVHLATDRAAQASARNQLPGTVTSVRDEGVLVRVDVDCGFALAAYVTRGSALDLHLAPGRPVTANVKAPHVHVVPRAGQPSR